MAVLIGHLVSVSDLGDLWGCDFQRLRCLGLSFLFRLKSLRDEDLVLCSANCGCRILDSLYSFGSLSV